MNRTEKTILSTIVLIETTKEIETEIKTKINNTLLKMLNEKEPEKMLNEKQKNKYFNLYNIVLRKQILINNGSIPNYY